MGIKKKEYGKVRFFSPTIFTHDMAKWAELMTVNTRTPADMVGTAKGVQF